MSPSEQRFSSMPINPAKKTISIAIKRERVGMPRVLLATAFRVRNDKSSEMVEIRFLNNRHRGERVMLDTLLLKSNLAMLNRYSSGLEVEPDDTSERDEITLDGDDVFSNIVHFAHSGSRAETTFGLFSISDYAEAIRNGKSTSQEIRSQDLLVVLSTTALQKQFLIALTTTINTEH